MIVMRLKRNRVRVHRRSEKLLVSYVRWACTHPKALLGVSVVLAVVCGVYCRNLPVRTGFANLLPPSATSVRQLHALEARTLVPSTFMLGVESDSPVLRDRAAHMLEQKLRGLDSTLVAEVTWDHSAMRQYIWANRFLFTPYEDLIAAKKALLRAIDRESPFDCGLEDQDDDKTLDDLERTLDEQERNLSSDAGMVSSDGRLQMILLRTTFSSDDIHRGERLAADLQHAADDVGRSVGSGVTIGMTGDVLTTLSEQRALSKGMLFSTICTVMLVGAGLFWFFGSPVAVASILWSLGIGVIATFVAARVLIGHLNLASAFLSSIVIGNGINFGILLTSRYLEARRSGQMGQVAVTDAVKGAAPGTAVAALTAIVAYGSLMVTPFRGFRDFGIIGSIGMAFCWLSTFTFLPPMLLLFERRIDARKQLDVGRWLSRLAIRKPAVVVLAALALGVATTAVTVRFLTHDPIEHDMRNLRSDTPELTEASQWMDKFDRAFGHGISGGFVIGATNNAEVNRVVAQLRAMDRGRSEREQLFSRISSLDDLLPSEQSQKLALLGQLRELLDHKIMAHASAIDRRRLARLRPPEHLRPLGYGDIPNELAWPYVERDGTRGRLVLVNSGLGVNSWDLRSLIHFADLVRPIGFNRGVLIGGSAFIFSDMLEGMQRDGLRATLVALLGTSLVVLLLAGLGRFALATLASTWLGTLTMVAIASLLGIKINFFDFVALPITLGISIDYSVNLALRAQQESKDAGRRALSTTGGAVIVCSYTTIIGYASLLFSQNLGIHTFGLTAMLGEATCLFTAVLLTPALIDWLHHKQQGSITQNTELSTATGVTI